MSIALAVISKLSLYINGMCFGSIATLQALHQPPMPVLLGVQISMLLVMVAADFIAAPMAA